MAQDPDLSNTDPESAFSIYNFSALSNPLLMANFGFSGKYSSLII